MKHLLSSRSPTLASKVHSHSLTCLSPCSANTSMQHKKCTEAIQMFPPTQGGKSYTGVNFNSYPRGKQVSHTGSSLVDTGRASPTSCGM